MAEIVMLWEGGTRADQWSPVSGDAINTKVSSKFATIEWPSNRDAMGLVEPYFIRTTFLSDNSGTTRDAVVALQFHNLPQTVGNDKFIQFNASLVVHENGKKIDDSYRVEISLNNSYINDAFLMQSGDSITYSGNCDNMAVTLPVDIKYIKFTIRNLPSKYECFFCLNKILISDTEVERQYESFNDTIWIKKYAHIVEDPSAVSDDEYIKNYVNWPAAEVQTYENGNHTLSPLGFPNENNSGVPNVPDCAESGSKPVFVSQMFGVQHTIPSDILDNIAFTSKVNISNLRGCSIVIPVLSLGAYDENTKYEIVVNGDISNIRYNKMGIEAIGADTLANTHLLRGNIIPSEVAMEYDADSDSTYVTIAASPDCEITHLGANVIGLSFTYSIYPVYISLQGQTDANENGIYMLTDATSYWRKLGADLREMEEITDLTDPDTYPYADRTAYDNVWVCCDGINKPHFRRNYSDREVYDYTNARTGVYTGFGVHSPEIGSNACNGAFVQWFVSSGQVDLAAGNSYPVIVDAFGLGDAYSNNTNTTPADANTVERGDVADIEPLHPVLQWGIGANADAKDAVSKVTALPLDWPFSRVSTYATTANNNNITLVREGAEIAGSSDTFGNLDYTDEDGNRVEINKHIITIYNDLRPTAKETQVVDGVTVNGHGSGEDGATVIKPTFIHIPAPLSTKDGDTVEIEVALENINIEQAFPGATAKDLSGYYALMSQPRVYVVGGFQNIISTRYKVNDPTIADITTDYFDVVTKDVVVRKDNNDILPVGTDVRLQLVSTQMKPTHNYFTARVVAKTDNSTKFRCYGKFPYDLGGRGWKANALAVCGIAYMAEVPDDELNPSTTPMGLVTRTAEILGVDYGEGGEGDLDQYNKFFSLNRHVEGRYTFPGNDKRYLLATVYQSSTSTFPWALSGRKKLRHLNKLMTNEADLGPNSITAQAWELNKELLTFNDSTGRDFRDVSMDSDRTYFRFSAEDVPVSYNSTVSVGEGESAIASKLRVTLPTSLGGDYIRTSDGNPVRQARRAYHELVNDFKLTRCGFGDKLTSSYSMNGCGIDIGIDGRDAMPAKDAFFAGRTQIAYNNDPEDEETFDDDDLTTNAFPLYNVGDDMWAIKLRHIPLYMRDAYYDTAYMSYNHYWEGFDGRFKDYLTVSDYCSEMGIVTASTDSEAEIGCSLVGTPNMPRRYSEQRSVLKVINTKYASIHTMLLVRDMSKFADTQESWIDESLRNIEHRYKGNLVECTECGGTGTIMGIDEPEECPVCHGKGCVEEAPADLPAAWEEIWSSCTKIFSIDYVPYPEAKASDADALPETQHAFVSGDVVQKYVDAGITDDPIRIVTEIMPQSTEEDLLKVNTFMANLTPEYASGLPKRFYASSRILLKNGACEDDDMYFKCAKWVERLYENCDDKTALINRYVNDNFALLPDEAGTLSSIDRNMDWRNLISGDATERSLELNMSAPPYTVDNTFVSQIGNAGGTGYTRMYMQFTFCAKAGRWMTTGYRQYPSSFLTPLYGAKALKAKLGSNIAIDSEHGDYVWADSMCDGFGQNYHVATSLPYVAYEPMDIRLSCIPYLYENKPYDMYGDLLPEATNEVDAIDTIKMDRLLKPYLPIADGGLDLYPPANVNGDDMPATRAGIHANIWSVRKYLRPAVTALYGTDIPSEEERSGGSISDPTLHNMFDFPPKGIVRYHIPDVVDPTIDRTARHLVYAEDGELGDIVTDKGEFINVPETNP